MPIIRRHGDIDQDALTPAERALLAACRAGEECTLGDGKRPPEDAGPDRCVGSDLLRYLILGGCADWPVEGWGVRLVGARITGRLDLSFQTAKGGTGLTSCRFDDPITAFETQFQFLVINESHVPGLLAQGAEVKGSVFLSEAETTGEVSLAGAVISGSLACEDATLNGGGAKALNAQGAEVRGSVFLRRAETTGEVSLAGAVMGGSLACEGATLNGDGAMALNAEGAEVKGGVFLDQAETTGEVSLAGAVISGQLACEDATLNGGGAKALNAQGAEVRGSVFLRRAETTGEVSLAGAFIGGSLACEGATLNGDGAMALNAEGAEVKGGVFLDQAETTGEVSLAGAVISGQLACGGATLNGDGAMALNAEGAEVKGGVFLSKAKTTGEVSLAGAVIGVLLKCDGATFDATGDFESKETSGPGISGMGGEKDWVTIGPGTLGQATRPAPDPSNPKKALNMLGMQLTGILYWRAGVRVVSGIVDLNSVHVFDIVDDLDCWPRDGTLVMNGLTYDRLYVHLDAKARLAWLASGSYVDGEFRPQPYTHLAKHYRDLGRDADSRRVLMARDRREGEDLRRRKAVAPDGSLAQAWRSTWADLRNGLRWLWDQTLRWGVGYGFAPQRALYALVAIWLVATVLAHTTWEAGHFAPNSGPVQVSQAWQALITCPDGCPENPAAAWSAQGAPGQDWETFNRYLYAADLVIPLIDLGQTDAWAPSTERGPWGERLWRYGPILHLLGWFVTALGAAAITGIIRRD